MALQKKMEEDFSQVETIQIKVKALSADWETRHQQLKVEQEKVAELEAQIKQLNTKQEEVMASLQADMLRAASQIQEKEGLAERLRSEIAFLEKRVRVACQEAAGSAAELEKGAHEARLALEATLSTLCPQLDKEELENEILKSKQEASKPPQQHGEQFLCSQDTEGPGKAEGAEAAAGEALQGQPQEAVGGLLEEAEHRAHGGVGPPIFFWLLKGMHWGSPEPPVSRESPFWERLLQLERGENCPSVCYHSLF
ncbi:uncharacterized protein LOC131187131 isoform X2 [Ahaetulla prasina]|nr:uncharacterized protein LOC131187131 isoform X2 [Ahaetulla prasina]